MYEDFDRCFRAVQSKDARFDGWFVTAVLTTKIYCRPSCPARPPFAKNLCFLPTAAAAQRAGFRACKRCRPDASPGSPEWNVRQDLVGRAMRLIADGTVDRDGVTGLASRLGYSTRQLERHLVAEVGAGPLALARAQRAQTARLLIETTGLPFTDVAFASGFSSIRQFNDTVRMVFDATPTSLRDRSRRRHPTSAPGVLTFRLPFRTPFSPESLFGHLAATAVPGCEEVRHGTYRRTLRLPAGSSVVGLTPTPDHVVCQLALDDLRDLSTAIARCRRLLDLDADPEAVVEVLGGEPALTEAVAKAPGRRLPGTVDEAELAVRIVLGQQVSDRRGPHPLGAASGPARHPGERHRRRAHPPVPVRRGPGRDRPVHARPARGPPTLRRRPGRGPRLGPGGDRPGADWDRARRQLGTIAGIGTWTAEMIAMRALGDPDAFPAVRPGRQAGRPAGAAGRPGGVWTPVPSGGARGGPMPCSTSGPPSGARSTNGHRKEPSCAPPTP